MKIMKNKGCRRVIDDPETWDSIPGIVRVYIKAYKTFNIATYKEMAEEILMEYPMHIVHDNFNQDNGLAGLGEIYLEAYRAFANPLWLKRAGWICNFFMHTYITNDKEGCYWIGNNSTISTAGFMVGNSGILHFLINFISQGRAGYQSII